MSEQVVRVEPADLRAMAAALGGNGWITQMRVDVQAPDGLKCSQAAVQNLSANAKAMLGFQRWIEAENDYLAQLFANTATAYEAVDAACGKALEAPGRAAAVEQIQVVPPQVEYPPPPVPVGAQETPAAVEYYIVPETEKALQQGDDGASLRDAWFQWSHASRLADDAQVEPDLRNWEGEAADAAQQRLHRFNEQLVQLSEGWRELAQAADKIRQAHEQAQSAHTPVAEEYEQLEEQLKALPQRITPGNYEWVMKEQRRIHQRMEELQKESDGIREGYARDATFSPVRPDMPTTRSGTGSASGGSGRSGGGSADGRPGSGEQDGGGDARNLADRMGDSLGGPTPQGAGSGGAPAGGEAPTGGAAPAGGVPAGMPTGTPGSELPTDPLLRPAAASAGGGGAGGGGAGGGGGGMPATPMSAPVAAETVAPAPTSTTPVSAPAPTQAGTGGMMGGGMAPMAHGAGAGAQGKEKKRDPRLAPEEDLYIEDRPWTEAVIGNRRRSSAGKSEGTENK